jgi:hypothetical protein
MFEKISKQKTSETDAKTSLSQRFSGNRLSSDSADSVSSIRQILSYGQPQAKAMIQKKKSPEKSSEIPKVPSEMKNRFPNLYAVTKKDIEETENRYKSRKFEVTIPHPSKKRGGADMYVTHRRKRVLLESGKEFCGQTFLGVEPKTTSILIKKKHAVLNIPVIILLPSEQFFNLLTAMADREESVKEELLQLPEIKP